MHTYGVESQSFANNCKAPRALLARNYGDARSFVRKQIYLRKSRKASRTTAKLCAPYLPVGHATTVIQGALYTRRFVPEQIYLHRALRASSYKSPICTQVQSKANICTQGDLFALLCTCTRRIFRPSASTSTSTNRRFVRRFVRSFASRFVRTRKEQSACIFRPNQKFVRTRKEQCLT